MKYTYIYILGAVLFFSLLSSVSAQEKGELKWLKRTAKAEEHFKDGKYDRAYRRVKRILRRQEKRNKVPHLKSGTAALLAKYRNAMGFGREALDLKQKHLQLLGNSEVFRNLDEIRTAELLYIISYFVHSKQTAQADDKLELFNNGYNPNADPDSSFYLDYLKLKSDNYLFAGRYNKALTKVDEALRLAQRKTDKTIRIYTGNGESEEIRQQSKHIEENELSLGNLMVDKAEIYMEYGDLKRALKLFEENEVFLSQIMPKRYFPYIRNTFGTIYAKFLLEEYTAKKAAKKQSKEIKRYANRMRYGLPNVFYLHQMERKAEMLSEADKFGRIETMASKYARESLKGFGRGNYHHADGYRIKVLNDMSSGRYISAERKMELVEEDAENLSELHPQRLSWNEIHATIKKALFKFDQQETFLQNNIAIAEANFGKDAPIIGKYKLDFAGFVFKTKSDFKKSGELYDEGISTYLDEIHEFHSDYFKYYEAYVSFLTETDQLDSALFVSQSLIQSAMNKRGTNSMLSARMNALKADVLIEKGEYIEAQTALEEAVKNIENAGKTDGFGYIKTLLSLGDIYNINGQTDRAEKTFKTAYKLSNRLSGIEQFDDLSSPEDLAATYLNAGNYDAAGSTLDKIIKTKSKKYGAEDYKLYTAYYLKGQLNYTLGEYTVAERFVRKAQSTLVNSNMGEDGSKQIDTEVLLGDVYTGMGNYGKADERYAYALENWRHKFGFEHIKSAEILTKKAKLYLKWNEDREEVVNMLDTAARIVQKAVTDRHPQYAEAIELKGKVLIELEEFDEALKLLNTAAHIYEDTYGSKHLKAADNNAIIGDLYYRKGEYKVAVSRYDKSVKSYKNLFDEYHPKYVGTVTKIAQSYYAQGNYKEASKKLDEATEIYLSFIRRFFPALSEKEKAKFWMSIRPVFELYNSLALEYGKDKNKVIRNMYSNQIATKALLLNSSVKIKKTILNSGKPALIEEFNELLEKRALLTSTLGMTQAERNLNDLNLNSIERDINRLEKSLSEQTGVFGKSSTDVPSWRKVKRSLNDGEAVVEIVRFNYFSTRFTDSTIYAALIITPNTKWNPELVILGNGNDMEKRYFKYYTNTVKFKTKDKFSYSVFWEPIEKKLDGASKVYFSPDGVYNQLNPETFDNGTGYLLDEYEFVQISNSKDLVNQEEKIEDQGFVSQAVLFGNPDFTAKSDTVYANESAGLSREGRANKVSSVAPLPGAEKEVKEIQGFLESRAWEIEKYLNAAATEEMVKSVQSPKVLHIATHGFFVDKETLKGQDNTNEIVQDYKNPLLKSGLLFTGSDKLLKTDNVFEFNREAGILTAYEAMNLSLDNTELVVLSACETGRGEIQAGEGVFGLQRAFKVAGADAIIMTLFKVDDEATQKLMKYFYGYWLESANKREAFLKAKQQIKEQYDSPIYWGSFVMIGGE